MDYPIEVALKRPVTVDDVTYDKLVFDEPDVATSIAVQESSSPAQQVVTLIAGMAGVDRGVVLKLKEGDYREINTRVIDPYQADLMSRRGDVVGNDPVAE